jgi:nucleoside-diphosphate-sugar epimerase
MKRVLVTGAGGFIGNHLVNKLKEKNYTVFGADLKLPEYSKTNADEFYVGDLRDINFVEKIVSLGIDEIYQLAADMGGAGYIFTGDNDADIMTNSSLININILQSMVKYKVINVFFASSACIYPEYNQLDPDNPNCEESSVYPAHPDSEYGWEKIFSERLYLSYTKNYNINARIARFHNVFGPECAWNNGKEKSPAALCRKVAECPDGGTIDIWGPGTQTRSFLYIDECIDGIFRLMDTNINEPINIGSDRMISINDFAKLIATMAGKTIHINNVKGPLGVMGRNSDNKKIMLLLNWKPQNNLEYGITEIYNWIQSQLNIGK